MAGVNISGVADSALNLKNMLDGVLERVQATFQEQNVSLPNRQYWSLGTAIVDSEQLVVSVMQMYLGAPGAEVSTPQRYHMPRSVTLGISISRATPVVGMNGRPPSANQIEDASVISAIDAWILMECINKLDMWDETGYGVGVIATLEAADPQGGFQTVTMQITMAIP
jgi:hypothetical protein